MHGGALLIAHGRQADSESLGFAVRSCLGCHDDTIAPGVEKHASGGFGLRGNHPVGTDYQGATVHRRRARLRGAGPMDERVLLPDGKVECLSCHDPFGGRRSLLVFSNALLMAGVGLRESTTHELRSRRSESPFLSQKSHFSADDVAEPMSGRNHVTRSRYGSHLAQPVRVAPLR